MSRHVHQSDVIEGDTRQAGASLYYISSYQVNTIQQPQISRIYSILLGPDTSDSAIHLLCGPGDTGGAVPLRPLLLSQPMVITSSS